jgi:hypothetical protein
LPVTCESAGRSGSFGARKELRSVFALWGRVPYYLPSGTPTSPPEKRDSMSNQFTYTLNASFITDRELSEEELNAIVSQVAPQIEEPINDERSSVDYEVRLISCEIGSLLIEEKENYSCGGCGEICEAEEGTIALNSGLIEFTHKAELCPAQDEIEGE